MTLKSRNVTFWKTTLSQPDLSEKKKNTLFGIIGSFSLLEKKSRAEKRSHPGASLNALYGILRYTVVFCARLFFAHLLRLCVWLARLSGSSFVFYWWNHQTKLITWLTSFASPLIGIGREVFANSQPHPKGLPKAKLKHLIRKKEFGSIFFAEIAAMCTQHLPGIVRVGVMFFCFLFCRFGSQM